MLSIARICITLHCLCRRPLQHEESWRSLCIGGEDQPRAARQSSTNKAHADSPTHAPVQEAIVGNGTAADMKGKAGQFEAQLSHATPTPTSPQVTPSTSLESYTSSVGGTWYVHGDDSPRPVMSGMAHKTRQFGQSHWMNVAVLVRYPPVFAKCSIDQNLLVQRHVHEY